MYSAEWDDVSNSIDQRCINFLKILSDLYCTHFPKRTKFVSAKRLQKPWLTPGILNSVKTKSKYFKQYKMGIISKETNTTYRNLLNKVIRRAKRSYYADKFKNASGDIVVRTWRNIRRILSTNKCPKNTKSIFVHGNLVDDPLLMAEHFNDFFTNVAANLEREIPMTSESPLKYVASNNLSSFFYIQYHLVKLRKLQVILKRLAEI